MPEDTKKNHQKRGKHEAKEQRKPRQRHQAGPAAPVGTESKTENKISGPKVPAPVPEKPVYQEPGPEFYKNLKRETDEILKITEEANSKYKKKEIQSNWSKYEMPIESYDEIEEKEKMGADYEKLIEAPLSIGGHFQFKHEKSWDINSDPSVYDKYFEINMDDLAVAISTIPFYVRNEIDTSNFSATDILTMNNRATKYKQKYYNDKKHTTVEIEARDKILNTMKECFKTENKPDDEEIEKKENIIKLDEEKLPILESNETIEDSTNTEVEVTESGSPRPVVIKDVVSENSKLNETEKPEENEKTIDDIDNIILLKPENVESNKIIKLNPESNQVGSVVFETTKETQVADVPDKTNGPIIESPEDLEKWLDDFLDG